MSGRMRYSLTLVFLAAAGCALALSLRQRADVLARPLEAVGERVAGWIQVDSLPLEGATLATMRPSEYLARTYRKGDDILSLFVAYYAQQRAGESMHSPRNCLPGNGWEIWKYDSAVVPGATGGVKINRFFIQNQGERMIVYYWYQSPGRVVANEYLGKLLLVRDTLLTGRTSGALVRVAVYDSPGIDGPAREFAGRVMQRLGACFGER